MYCNKTYTLYPVPGYPVKVECHRDIYKDGLCLKHFRRSQEKQINWENRDNYRDATLNDFETKRSLKLKGTNSNALYRYNNGAIEKYNSKSFKWEFTKLETDVDAFVVKIV